MKNRVTISDIAREANVSVATVSYVLNNRSDQKISENTKKKVLQITNFLGYTGNSFARSLATGKSNRVALYLGEADFPLRSSYYLKLISYLSVSLKERGYSLVLVPSGSVGRIADVDAIVSLNTTRQVFMTIGDANYVPLIAVDCLVDDPIFYQLRYDWRKIATGYDVIISLFYNDRRLALELSQAGNVVFVDSFLEIHNILNENKGKKILCLGATLYDYCREFSPDVSYHRLDHEALIARLLEVLSWTLEREIGREHDIRI